MGTVSGDGHAGSGGDEKIFVSIRLRPLNVKERIRNDVSDWECVNDDTIIYRNNLSVSERSMYPTGYTFDRVFSFDCSTRQVYNEGAKDVALSVVGGINASIFAYGQTSSGKTYTMSGITEYTVADIYDYLNKHIEREFIMKFSAMEIYNESVRDLLSTDSTPLRLLDDPERGTIVEKLTEETLRDWNHFRELLSICEDQRQIGETSLNEASSRSHQILRLTIESSSREFKGNDKASALSATVNFIDLAGSERASQTLSAGTRLKEGCHINRSLLTLGTVIRKLSKGRNSHVPYRDSKLTRILQSSLGGNARTAIICTLSPARSHVEQSRNTLLFASCAKEVATNAKVNVVMSDKALVKKLQRELARLESELSCAGTTTSSFDSSDVIREKDLQIEKLTKEVLEVTLQRDAAQSQVKDLLRAAEEDRHSVTVDLDQYYPKLRVRSSWDYEHQAPRALVLPQSQQHDSRIRSFDTTHDLDVQSSNSDENFYHEHDFDENSLPSGSSSPQMSARIPNFVEIDSHLEVSKEYSDDDLENVCKEVRCIEVEESSRNRHIDTNNRSFNSPEAKADVPDLKMIDDEVRPNEELGSPCFRKNADPSSFPPVFQISSPDKPYSWLVERDFSGSTCLKLTRSRSCRARVSAGIYSCLFDGEHVESSPPITLDTDFTGRPESLPKKVPALNYGADIEITLRNDLPEMAPRNGSVDKLPNIDSEDKLPRSDFPEKLSKPVSVKKLSTSDSHDKLSQHGSVEKSSTSDSHEKLSRHGSVDNLSRSSSQEKLLDSLWEVALSSGSQEEKSSRDGSPEITSKRTFREKKLSREASQEASLERGSQDEKLSIEGSKEMFPEIGSREGETISRIGSMEMLSRSHSQEKLSRNSSKGSSSSDDIDELKMIDSASSNQDESTDIHTLSDETEDLVNRSTEKTPTDSEVLVNRDEKLSMVATRSVKDVGLDPIQSDVESPPKWPSEFKRIQREIIELWHACNVSLVHRTYFLLLFRGDPSDSIYMEVELRRLSFIRNTFSHGSQTIEDGRTLTFESSLRALCRERLMLSRQMRKKLSKPERENIYLKWGIGLNAKHRRLQLAHRLWANTKDMDRIAESASIVVKLVGLEEPDQASKEMFGLRFTPRRTARRYYGLTQGVKSFLE